MNQEILKLKPKSVWGYFDEIMQIPRPSGKEQKITAYLKSFGDKLKLETLVDEVGNVLIRKPATKGKEKRPSVVLQSHVDMVCEKNSNIKHDFEKDPIKAVIEKGWLIAKETTLGADNGIGVAMQMAVLAAKDIEHGPIECLFTVDEETGLKGAFSLKSDFLKSRMLINLDSEEDGEFTIGCAGGGDTVARFLYRKEPVPARYEAFLINVCDLQGGHSGEDINKNRGNAVKLLNRILWNLSNKFEARIAYIKAGNLRNAIAREGKSICLIPKDKSKDFAVYFNKLASDIKVEYQTNEPKLNITCIAAKKPPHVLDVKTQQTLLNCLYACPHGVITMSPDIQGLVQTSTNLASVKMKGDKKDESDDKEIPLLKDNEIKIATSQRSSVESAKQDMVDMVDCAFQHKGVKISHASGYPGWKPNLNSKMLTVSKKSYKKLFGSDPLVKAIHAGLECGLIGEKYPGMDMISFGPTLLGVHAPGEKIEIHTVQKCYDLLLEVLKDIS
ncbi:MAG TPA: aminoacyl-histidine dipeptidase [Bacteroidales bacterium]|nr:aminoacyl-histidine dipeptidase [Bacteroidales bacterium]